MLYVLVAIAFLNTGDVHAVAVPTPFDTLEACKAYGLRVQEIAEARGKQDGVLAIVWGCQSVSNPLTERQS